MTSGELLGCFLALDTRIATLYLEPAAPASASLADVSSELARGYRAGFLCGAVGSAGTKTFALNDTTWHYSKIEP